MLRACVILVAAAACTPKLVGTCNADGDCQQGETCSADHLCLRGTSSTGDAGGNPGGGTTGGDTSATVNVVSPANGSIEPAQFHVAAQATSAIAIDGVEFVLSNPANGATLGTLTVTSASSSWSGTFAVDSISFGGSADLRAVVHRHGLADVVSTKVTLTIDQNAPSVAPTWDATRWYALDAGLVLTASVSDDRSGVGSALLTLPDGGTYAATLGGGVATFQVPAAQTVEQGHSAVVPLSLQAADLAGNQTATPDASVVRVDDEPPAVSVQRPDPAVWRTGALDFFATIGDGAGSGIASAKLLAAGSFSDGAPDAGGVYGFHADLAQSFPSTESAVTLQVVARDAVGNESDAGVTLLVDTVPPLVSDVRIDTAPDAVDVFGTGWFKGPTVAPGAGDIVVSAVVTETNLSGSPTATAEGQTVAGSAAGGRWTFALPRSVGLGATGAVAVRFDAQDAAGNHPISPPPLSLSVDDLQTLAATPSADTAFHGPNDTVSISVTVASPSGFPLKSGAVDLASAGSLAVGSCAAIPADTTSTFMTYPSASTLVFKVPVSNCIASGTDGAVSYAATVKSLVGGSASASGTVNIDTTGPAFGPVTVLYPAKDTTTPLGWSRDGTAFQRRDSGALFAFSAYDCRGLATAPLAVSIDGLAIATVSSAPDNTGFSPANCPGVRFTVSANLAAVATSSLPNAENKLGWSATLSDALGNQSMPSGAINVTRRLWRATPGGSVSFLALGPYLFAGGAGGLYAFDPATGAQSTWTATAVQMPLVAPNGGTPAILYSQGSAVFAGSASSFTKALFSGPAGCSDGATLDSFALAGASSVAYQSHTFQYDGTCKSGCDPVLNCGGGALADCSNCAVCQHKSNVYFDDGMTLSGGSDSCPGGGSAPATNCAGAPGAPMANGISLQNPSVFIGLSGGAWTAMAAGAVLNTAGSPVVTGSWPLADGSATPLVYLPGMGAAGGVDVRTVTAGGFGAIAFSIPTFPAAITDMQLAKNGILYVLSNGLLHAVVTDSAGGATASGGPQFSAWPSACRDPCRSSNSGVVCPY